MSTGKPIMMNQHYSREPRTWPCCCCRCVCIYSLLSSLEDNFDKWSSAQCATQTIQILSQSKSTTITLKISSSLIKLPGVWRSPNVASGISHRADPNQETLVFHLILPTTAFPELFYVAVSLPCGNILWLRMSWYENRQIDFILPAVMTLLTKWLQAIFLPELTFSEMTSDKFHVTVDDFMGQLSLQIERDNC